MSPPELPVSKTESRRALWAAVVLFVIIGLVIAVILIAPSGRSDNNNKPTAADPVAHGAMTGRTTPVVP